VHTHFTVRSQLDIVPVMLTVPPLHPVAPSVLESAVASWVEPAAAVVLVPQATQRITPKAKSEPHRALGVIPQVYVNVPPRTLCI